MDRSTRILIVEDERLEALTLERILVRLGYTVTAAVASGTEAIAQMSQTRPDLVLMDISLAGALDGIETGAYLHAHWQLPLIYLTGMKDDRLLERMKATEPYGYLLKPFQAHELQAAIELALYKHVLAERLQKTNRRLEEEITARQQAEQLVQQQNERLQVQNEELRASEERFHRMADNVQDGLIIVEHDHAAYLNDRACEILGCSRDEATRLSMGDLMAPDQPPPAPTRTVAAGYVGVVSQEDELWIKRRDDARRCIYFRHTADYQADGTLRRYIAITDITERKEMEEQLREASFRDALTGLYNRAYFEEELSRMERGRQSVVSVIMADVDGLKRINDGLGHWAGDDLLRRTAQVLRQPFRANDVVARIGGDEFAILLPQADATQAEAVVERIRESLRYHNSDHGEPLVSLSLGVATADFQAVSLAEAIRLADDRMYHDKGTRPLTRKA